MIYDVAVIGVGSMGSATCYQLSQRGISVLGIDQFSPPHNFGSHTGETRLIRKAYFEHPNYVPLLQRAYQLWEQLEDKVSDELFCRTGLLYMCDQNDFLINGLKKSAQEYKIELDKEYKKSTPAFENVQDKEVIFEENAGFVFPEKMIEYYIALALDAGVDFAFDHKIVGWHRQDDHYLVKTSTSIFHAKKIIFTTGAYTKEILDLPKVSLQVTKQSLFWMQPRHPLLFDKKDFSCWTLTDLSFEGLFYGFPMIEDEKGTPLVKIAHHVNGQKLVEPDGDKEVAPRDIKNLNQFLKAFMPAAFKKIVKTEVCYYTMTEDEHFVIDYFPYYDQDVIFAAGFSGHGFKFSPVIGEILADLAVAGQTSFPIDFLSLNRFN